MKKSGINKKSFIRQGYNFLKRTSEGVILRQSISPIGTIPEELKDAAYNNPDVTKAVLNQALRDKNLGKVDVDVESAEFEREISKRAIIKNVKQKCSFVIGSLPMFKTLQQISIAKALNPRAQVPLSMDLYFGVSMPAFVALHIFEHTLPPGAARKAIQGAKVVAGMPFCIISECVDRVTSKALKIANLPNVPLDMQGTLGVPSDLKLTDVLNDMKEWGEENADDLEELAKYFAKKRQKKQT